MPPEKDGPGAKVSLQDASKGLDTATGNQIFPNFDGREIDKFIKITPDSACSPIILVDYYKINFAIMATDTGTLSRLLNAIAGAVDTSSGVAAGGASVTNIGTAIGAGGKVVKDIGDALDQKDSPGYQKFGFHVDLCCHVKKQPFIVKLHLKGRMLISHVGEENDYVKLMVYFQAYTAHAEKDVKLDGTQLRSGQPETFDIELEVGFETEVGFDVKIELTENCHTDWWVGTFKPAVSLIKIDDLDVTIRTAEECKEGAQIPAMAAPKVQEPKITWGLPQQEKGTELTKEKPK